MIPRETVLKSKKSFKSISPKNGASPQGSLIRSHRFNPYLSTDSRVVEQQYAIKNDSGNQMGLQRVRSIPIHPRRHQDIYNKYNAKLQTDADQHSRELTIKRSISSSRKSRKHPRSISGENKNIRQGTVQTRKKSLNRSSMNVVMGPQRYIRLSFKDIQSRKDQQYERKIFSLEKEIDSYKHKYQSSLKAIKKMNKFILNEQSKCQLQKHVYEQKIRILKSQLESKNQANQQYSRVPHLFTYQNEKRVLPESMILQNAQEYQNSSLIKEKSRRIRDSPQTQLMQMESIMQDYLTKLESKNSSQLKSNLSIQSK